MCGNICLVSFLPPKKPMSKLKLRKVNRLVQGDSAGGRVGTQTLVFLTKHLLLLLHQSRPNRLVTAAFDTPRAASVLERPANPGPSPPSKFCPDSPSIHFQSRGQQSRGTLGRGRLRALTTHSYCAVKQTGGQCCSLVRQLSVAVGQSKRETPRTAVTKGHPRRHGQALGGWPPGRRPAARSKAQGG